MKNIFLLVSCTVIAVFMLLAVSGCDKKSTTYSATVTFSGPKGMTMSYNGKELNGLVRKIVPGTYIFKFSAPGHKTIWKSCTISSADNGSTIPVQLEAERSVILVTCSTDEPGKDANVSLSLNGVEQGATPCLITGLPLGEHILEFTHPGHATKNRKITITSSRPQPVIKEQLSSNNGILQAVGTPAGSILYINEKTAGPVPYQAKYPAGTYLLELRAPGYISQTKEITVHANRTVKTSFALLPEPSSIFIETEPANAVCVVRGEKRGTTPLKINNLQPGNYKIEVSLPGYETIEEMVEVKAGSHEKLKITLESGLGQARLNIRPAGVDVLVNGKIIGRTEKGNSTLNDVKPILLSNLAPGTYTCVISHPFAKPRKQKKFTFRVNRNKTTECPVVELWVPDHELTYRNGVQDMVKMIRITENEVEFELLPGMIVTERRSNVSIRKLAPR